MNTIYFKLNEEGNLVRVDGPNTEQIESRMSTQISTRRQSETKSGQPESVQIQTVELEQKQNPLPIHFNPKPAPSSNPRRRDLDAAYGVVARLEQNPNQPELIEPLQRYLNELGSGLQALETEHQEMQQQFADLQDQTQRLEEELQRGKVFKICANHKTAWTDEVRIARMQ